MLQFLPAPLQGSILFIALAVNTMFCCLLLYLVALVKLLFPIHSWRIVFGKLANAIAQLWVGFNNLGLKVAKNIRWDVQGIDALRSDAWYLLVANHQSMVDIVVLQNIFHRKTPILKFLLKKELIWVPFLGIAWWALDFPFMERKSVGGRDMETVRKACDKFSLLPVTIMNFIEGTRFTTAKRDKDDSRFTHLLKPKPGGIAVVLSALGRRLHSILDVTIIYPEKIPSLWTFLCSSSMEIKVRVRQIPITSELLGDYLADQQFRQRFKDWLDRLWDEKDKLIGTLYPLPAGMSPTVEDNRPTSLKRECHDSRA
jgi:1-acyl-sn-glycerol-3-phosphate acyltransferase